MTSISPRRVLVLLLHTHKHAVTASGPTLGGQAVGTVHLRRCDRTHGSSKFRLLWFCHLRAFCEENFADYSRLFQHSLNYQQYFVQPMLQYICDKQCELRQAAAYGIGVMAQFGGEGYAQTLTGALRTCVSISNSANVFGGWEGPTGAEFAYKVCLLHCVAP